MQPYPMRRGYYQAWNTVARSHSQGSSDLRQISSGSPSSGKRQILRNWKCFTCQKEHIMTGSGQLHRRWDPGQNENWGTLMKIVKNANTDTVTLCLVWFPSRHSLGRRGRFSIHEADQSLIFSFYETVHLLCLSFLHHWENSAHESSRICF